MLLRNRWISTLIIIGGVGICGGTMLFSDDESIAIDKLPKLVMDAIKAKFPKAMIVEAEKDKDDGRTFFEIELTLEGTKMTAKVAENGGIVETEKEIATKDLPKLVVDAIMAKHPNAKISAAEEVTEVKYEVTIETADGKKTEVVLDASGHEDDDHAEKKAD